MLNKVKFVYLNIGVATSFSWVYVRILHGIYCQKYYSSST
ncbi:putative membrane protein [Escherichia coli 2-210-07_S3_C3]|nr:putative membrane protein [Escherichia coli 2-210-07_S3_C3]